MFKSASSTVSALATAALVAFAITILPGASERVSANSPLNSGKGDRIDIRHAGPDCSKQAWPYLETVCVKDRTRPMSQAKPVRIVTTDRISTNN